MDQLGRIESKLDALLEAQSVTWEEPEPQAPPELTAAQQEAIANAPVVAVPPPPETETTEEAQKQARDNAPKVKVPGQEGDIASVTVETQQPSGQTDPSDVGTSVTTIPPSEGETPPPEGSGQASVPRRR